MVHQHLIMRFSGHFLVKERERDELHDRKSPAGKERQLKKDDKWGGGGIKGKKRAVILSHGTDEC